MVPVDVHVLFAAAARLRRRMDFCDRFTYRATAGYALRLGQRSKSRLAGRETAMEVRLIGPVSAGRHA
jgi:hypothetical protein